MRRALIVGGATAALALSSVGIALAGSTPRTPPEQLQRGVSEPVTTSCDGGALKQVRTVSTDNSYFYPESGTPQVVKGAKVTVSGPARKKDTVVVTFSATSALGNSTNGEYDSATLRARVDGSTLRPGRDDQAVVAGSSAYESASLQFCGRIGSGRHTIDLTTQIFDNATDDGLYLFLDDWTMKVEVYN